MKTQFALALSAFFAITAAAQAAPRFGERALDASVLAEVVTSGGFMAPGAVNTTTYTVKKNGDIERTAYRRGDLTPATQSVELVGKLGAETQDRLERAMAEIREGKLVDVDPSSPMGADAPSTSYNINRDGQALTVALRGGNFHTYALKQKAALVIMKLLEKAVRE